MKLYNISFNNLRRRKAKMVFLVMGLFIGIATIVTLLSITESMSRDIEDRLDRFGANIVMVPKSENLALSYGGITVGGASLVDIEDCLVGNNGQAQLLTLPFSETHVRRSELLSNTAPGWVNKGGRVYIDGKRGQGSGLGLSETAQ